MQLVWERRVVGIEPRDGPEKDGDPTGAQVAYAAEDLQAVLAAEPEGRGIGVEGRREADEPPEVEPRLPGSRGRVRREPVVLGQPRRLLSIGKCDPGEDRPVAPVELEVKPIDEVLFEVADVDFEARKAILDGGVGAAVGRVARERPRRPGR